MQLMVTGLRRERLQVEGQQFPGVPGSGNAGMSSSCGGSRNHLLGLATMGGF